MAKARENKEERHRSSLENTTMEEEASFMKESRKRADFAKCASCETTSSTVASSVTGREDDADLAARTAETYGHFVCMQRMASIKRLESKRKLVLSQRNLMQQENEADSSASATGGLRQAAEGDGEGMYPDLSSHDWGDDSCPVLEESNLGSDKIDEGNWWEIHSFIEHDEASFSEGSYGSSGHQFGDSNRRSPVPSEPVEDPAEEVVEACLTVPPGQRRSSLIDLKEPSMTFEEFDHVPEARTTTPLSCQRRSSAVPLHAEEEDMVLAPIIETTLTTSIGSERSVGSANRPPRRQSTYCRENLQEQGVVRRSSDNIIHGFTLSSEYNSSSECSKARTQQPMRRASTGYVPNVNSREQMMVRRSSDPDSYGSTLSSESNNNSECAGARIQRPMRRVPTGYAPNVNAVDHVDRPAEFLGKVSSIRQSLDTAKTPVIKEGTPCIQPTPLPRRTSDPACANSAGDPPAQRESIGRALPHGLSSGTCCPGERSFEEQMESLTESQFLCVQYLLGQWNQSKCHKIDMDEETCLRFARNCPGKKKFSDKASWKLLQSFNQKYLNLSIDKVEKQLRTRMLFPVPGLKSSEGYDLFYMKPSRYLPKNTSSKVIIENLVYVMQSMLQISERSSTEGIGFVADLEGFTMSNFTVPYWQKFMTTLQGRSVPVQVKMFLIVNPPAWFSSIWKIMKAMLSPSFRKVVQIIHDSKLDKFLANGWQEFAPRELREGLADSDQIVSSFVEERRRIEHQRALKGKRALF